MIQNESVKVSLNAICNSIFAVRQCSQRWCHCELVSVEVALYRRFLLEDQYVNKQGIQITFLSSFS